MTDTALSTTAQPIQRPLYGIVLMMISIVLYALQDAIAKHLSPDYTPIQILFFRALGVLLIMIPLLRQVPARAWISKQPVMLLIRCLMGGTSMVFYILAVRSMPLADVSAIGFSSVLFVAILSSIVLGEKLDKHRWAGIAFGFIGVLVVLRPGTGILGMNALWPLAGAVSFALMTLALRVLIRTDHPITITGTFAVFMAIGLGLLLPAVWRTPDAFGLMWLLAQGVVCGGAQLLMTSALRAAPASVVSPFSYTIIIHGLIIGYFWFGDVPDALMLTGSAILICSCLYLARREHLEARKNKAIDA